MMRGAYARVGMTSRYAGWMFGTWPTMVGDVPFPSPSTSTGLIR